MKKLGLALGSGGARGVAHVGFLQALEESGITPSFIAGSSMGSVVGACYAMGMRPKEMLNEILKLKAKDVVDFSPTTLKAGSLLSSKRMHATLAKYMGGMQFEDLRIPFRCVGVDVISGKEVIFSQGDLTTAVQASSSIPLFFQPVDYDDMLVCDGGVLCRVPIRTVKQMGAQVVIGFDVLGPLREIEEINGVMGYFLRLIDIYDCRITQTHRKENPADLFLAPDLGDMSPYVINTEKLKFAYIQGYKTAKAHMDEIISLIE